MTSLTLHRMCADIAALLDEPVAPDDDLLERGLDSIALMRLAAGWAAAGADITFAQLIEYRTAAEWHGLVNGTAAKAAPETLDVDENASFALATMQHAYWVGRGEGQVLGGVGAHFYNEFDGSGVQPERLERAVRALIRRHGMLRARFLADGTQEITAEDAWPGLVVHDLRRLPAEERTARLAALRSELSHRRLDVDRGEVFDVQLSLLPDGANRIHVDIEMLVADAHSFRNLLADLAALYRRPDEPLPPLDFSYPRYLATHTVRREEAREKARAYWQERLADLPGGPELPTAVAPERLSSQERFNGQERLSRQERFNGQERLSGHRVERQYHWLSGADRDRLAARAREHGVTLPMVFLTAFAEVLAAWSGQQRFLLNLPLYDRIPYHPDVPNLVGDFTNLLLLEVDARDEIPFLARIRRLQERFAADAAHAAYSGVEVLRDLARVHPDRRLNAPVVFTSALSLGELFSDDVRECFGTPAWTSSQTPQVWLDNQVTEREGGLYLNWDVVAGLFPTGVVEAMFAAYVRLLDRLADHDWSGPQPDLLPAGQRAIRDQANATAEPIAPALLHESFFRQPPERVALAGDFGRVTYGELAARALEVAGALRERGVEPGDTVAVSLPKGPEQIAAVFGVLAAGGTYVPIGVDQPAARRQRILDRAGAKVVVDGPLTGAPLERPVAIRPDQIAYIIFTSGSTGEPKGVEVAHAAAMNTITALRNRFALAGDDRVLAVSALDFDLSVFDIFGLLGAGGTVVLIDESQRRDAAAWLRLVAEHRVTIWQSVPALLDMLLTAAESGGELESVRLALLGGDWVGLDLRKRLVALRPDARLIALGGTTETAIHSTVFEVGDVPPAWTSIPYGVPLPNQVCRVVDGRGRDCPDHVTGELWIGGASVARGYRGDPELTARKFVERDGVRWYRTGDLGRYWPDGTLEFLGRADFQVKIRGHRIELGEIEAALTAVEGVREAVAVATGRHLAAAVVGAPDVDIKAVLADRLPTYMVPEHIAHLDALPLSGNGKIDRRAVTARLAGVAAPTAAAQPPSGPVETVLAAVWADLLGVPTVGRDDSFFALGGDSLLATRLIGRMRAAGLAGGELRRLFATPTLAEFAAGLRLAAPPGTEVSFVADPARRYEPFPPTDVQRAYWMGRGDDYALGEVGSHWYWEFDGVDVDLDRLVEAWNRLVGRHEMLRAVFDPDGRQRIQAEVPRVTIPVTEGGGEALDALRERLSHRVADPTRWPLVAIEAVRYGGNRTRLAFSFDYIVLDALSIVTVFSELSALYTDLDAPLRPVDVSFRDYVLTAKPNAATVEADERYWAEQAADMPPAPQLPLAADPERMRAPRFVRYEFRLAESRWSALTGKAREHAVTPAAVLATAFAEVLSAWSARGDLTLNLTLFDRREVHPHIDHILGDFTSLLLVPHRPETGDGFLALVRRLQEQMWTGMERGSVSAIWVLRELARHTGAAAALMPVVFTSALGVSDDLVNMALPFGEQIWGVSQTPQVWLDNQVMERDGGLSVNWDVVSELFPPGVVEGMFAAYTSLLDGLVDADWSTVLLDLLPADQRAVRERVNDTAAAIAPALLHEGFFRQAPERLALTGDFGSLSYGELASRALTVAGVLREQGVGPGDPVGVCLPKGPEQIAAVLGVLAAGGAYVPVGADQPAARRDRIFTRAGVKAIVDGPVTGPPVPRPTMGSPDQPAYVIFTSGSTGEPKGVEVTHAAAMNTITAIRDRYGVTGGDRVLAVSALDFDLSVFDIFGLLGAGGTLVLIDEGQRRDARAWVRLVREHGVTLWNTVPALLDMLLTAAGDEPLGDLRLALVSGDWVGLDLRKRLVANRPDARLIALGGATEAAIWSNAFEVTDVPAGWRSIPYGFPLPNQSYRVADSRGRDCPDWTIGELWIGGAGVATGYRGDPELTARKFVERDGVRWYRTGDLGRYWPDGTLEFLGRADFQVKIRGHRIELGEIEAALADFPGVREAVAVAIGTTTRRLAAAVTGPSDVDAAAARVFLTDRLPTYMVPEHIVGLDALPLSANGKVDRSAVARILASGDAGPAEEPLQVGLETELGTVWSDLLGCPVSGRGQNFFTLGGDSLLATRLLATLREKYGVDLPMRGLLDRPTIADLALAVSTHQNCAVSTHKSYEEGAI